MTQEGGGSVAEYKLQCFRGWQFAPFAVRELVLSSLLRSVLSHCVGWELLQASEVTPKTWLLTTSLCPSKIRPQTLAGVDTRDNVAQLFIGERVRVSLFAVPVTCFPRSFHICFLFILHRFLSYRDVGTRTNTACKANALWCKSEVQQFSSCRVIGTRW